MWTIDSLLRRFVPCMALAVGIGALARPPTAIVAGAPNPPAPQGAERASCVSALCHATIVDRRNMHEPVQARQCGSCHAPASDTEHAFRLTAPPGELCVGCHELTPGKVQHQPVADGNCTGCHDAHGSEHRALLLEENTAALCRRCHEQEYQRRQFVHGPVAAGACRVCHDPHSGAEDDLLVTRADRLCINCHRTLEARGPAARHLHKPMEEGCTTCHNPHASDVRFQLHQENTDLCTGCHAGVGAFLEAASMVHGPVTDSTGCTNCHNPHFTLLPDLQKLPQPELCLKCHSQPVVTPQGRILPDMAALLRENPDHHGPIDDGNCTACHHPHGGDRFGFLYLEYPADFYAAYEPARYELCFSCHLPDLVRDASGTGLTGFRDGDLNLHWMHVNQEKGRTCRACHEVHASKRPFHIRESVPFGPGGWMLEINFEQSADGGACLPGCHRPREYRRSAARRAEVPAENSVPGGEP